MPVVVQKGVPKPKIIAGLTPENIRDLLLSLPEEERTFVISEPQAGSAKVKNVYLKGIDQEIILIAGGE